MRGAIAVGVYLFRPYVDLSAPGDDCPLHARGPDLAYRVWTEPDRPKIWFQRLISSHFRQSLALETDLDNVAIEDPREVPASLRSERWSLLCEGLDNWATLGVDGQLGLARLLMSLCFYKRVLALVPPPRPHDVARSESRALLAVARASSRVALHIDGLAEQPYDSKDLEVIAKYAPPGKAKFNAAIHLLIQSVKYHQDANRAEYWAAQALEATQALRPDPFHYPLVMSRYYRAYGLVPQFLGDKPRLVAIMDQADEYAHAIPRRTPDEELLAEENLYSLLESRTKEAVWLGDLELAEERARRLVELTQVDAKAWIELGEVLARSNKVDAAAAAYTTAMRYGPPGTAIAAFMAAQCYEKLGELELAATAYMAAIRSDPYGVGAAKRLRALAAQMDDRALVAWCDHYLHRLQATASDALTGAGERGFEAKAGQVV